MYLLDLKCSLLYQLLKNVNLDVYYFLNLDVLLKPSMEELYQTELRNKKKKKKKKKKTISVYWYHPNTIPVNHINLIMTYDKLCHMTHCNSPVIFLCDNLRFVCLLW